MQQATRLRAACDRCHAQKIRCPRHLPGKSCDRCLTLGTACKYSPFREKKPHPDDKVEDGSTIPSQKCGHHEQNGGSRGTLNSKRQKKRIRRETHGLYDLTMDSPQPLSSNGNDLSNVAVPTVADRVQASCDGLITQSSSSQFPDLSSTVEPAPLHLDFGQALMMPFGFGDKLNNIDRLDLKYSDFFDPRDMVSLNSNDNFQGVPLLEAVDGGQRLLSECIRELSTLSIDLFEHSQLISPQFYGHCKEHIDPSIRTGITLKAPEYNVEDTLRLTKKLISMYGIFMDQYLHQDSCLKSDATHEIGQNPTIHHGSLSEMDMSTTLNAQRYGSRRVIDYSSIMLILSCHLRLINMYELLFEDVDVCVIQPMKMSNSSNASTKTSKPQVESFNTASASTPYMQMLLFLKFASQLFNCAATLAYDIRTLTPHTNSVQIVDDTTATLTQVVADYVKGKACRMSRKMADMQQQLLQIGFF